MIFENLLYRTTTPRAPRKYKFVTSNHMAKIKLIQKTDFYNKH